MYKLILVMPLLAVAGCIGQNTTKAQSKKWKWDHLGVGGDAAMYIDVGCRAELLQYLTLGRLVEVLDASSYIISAIFTLSNYSTISLPSPVLIMSIVMDLSPSFDSLLFSIHSTFLVSTFNESHLWGILKRIIFMMR